MPLHRLEALQRPEPVHEGLLRSDDRVRLRSDARERAAVQRREWDLPGRHVQIAHARCLNGAGVCPAASSLSSVACLRGLRCVRRSKRICSMPPRSMGDAVAMLLCAAEMSLGVDRFRNVPRHQPNSLKRRDVARGCPRFATSSPILRRSAYTAGFNPCSRPTARNSSLKRWSGFKAANAEGERSWRP
jgi:hypothetical protein